MITIDFETRSKGDIAELGASGYAQHPTTSLMCLAYSQGGQVHLWLPDDLPPVNLFWAIKDGELIEAHNAFFERSIWFHICHRRMGWPDIPFNQWRCSLAACSRLALPRSLEQAGKALNLPVKKDEIGRKIMLRLCKPKRPSKRDPGIWDNDPVKFKRLYEYCKQDVLTEEAISEAIEPLTPSELKVWQLDQRINLRGIAIDREAVENAIAVVDKTYESYCAELTKLSGGKFTTAKQVQRIVDFITEECNEAIPDLNKTTVDQWLDRDDLPPKTRRILEIRRQASNASTGKLKSMLARCESDDRVRGNLMYHGASTGRWAGSGIQIQNYPRGVLAPNEIDLVHRYLPTQNKEAIELLLGPPLECISSALRSMIVAAPNHRLMVCDFAQIEARVLAWIAGQSDLLQQFAEGQDVYKAMASKIYDVPEDEVDKGQRFIGKSLILGCFASDTQVLTHRGWVRIVDIKDSDLLWDGVEWVRHSGVLYQGRKTTLYHEGVRATSDHLCLTPNGWLPWEAVATNPHDFEKAIELVNLPFEDYGGPKASMEKAQGTCTKPNAVVANGSAKTDKTSTPAKLLVATVARRSQLPQNDIGSTSLPSTTTSIGPGYSTGWPPPLPGATSRRAKPFINTEGEAYRSSKNGETTGRSSSDISRPLKAGTTCLWKWIVSTTKAITGQGISGLSLAGKTWLTGDQSKNSKSRWACCDQKSKSSDEKTHVYDIKHCGPRNRFTIMTDKGPLIVHNCGYGMGWQKFKLFVALAGVKIDSKFARQVIKTYRDANESIAALWKALNTACMQVIATRQPRRVGRLEITADADWLRIKLPSGRHLHYRHPKLVDIVAPWSEGHFGDILGPVELEPEIEEMGIALGERKADRWVDCNVPKGGQALLQRSNIKSELEPKEPQMIKQIQFKACVGPARKWATERTYGGKLTENVVQATARDFLCEAMLRVEQAGYPIVATVHDEVISEVHDKHGSIDEFNRIMRQVPAWGRGTPIEVEGYEAKRYRK